MSPRSLIAANQTLSCENERYRAESSISVQGERGSLAVCLEGCPGSASIMSLLSVATASSVLSRENERKSIHSWVLRTTEDCPVLRSYNRTTPRDVPVASHLAS